MGCSVKVIDATYGHLARDSEAAILARLDARGGRVFWPDHAHRSLIRPTDSFLVSRNGEG
jgi:hypothetical protein